jgi:hypothetical protein
MTLQARRDRLAAFLGGLPPRTAALSNCVSRTAEWTKPPNSGLIGVSLGQRGRQKKHLDEPNLSLEQQQFSR